MERWAVVIRFEPVCVIWVSIKRICSYIPFIDLVYYPASRDSMNILVKVTEVRSLSIDHQIVMNTTNCVDKVLSKSD